MVKLHDFLRLRRARRIELEPDVILHVVPGGPFRLPEFLQACLVTGGIVHHHNELAPLKPASVVESWVLRFQSQQFLDHILENVRKLIAG